jgi:hypothetical protein
MRMSDEQTVEFLRSRGTRCETLPRTYAGVHLDYCWINSGPQEVQGSLPLILLLVDTAGSAVVDTFLLPRTLVQQKKKGDIPLR